MVTRRFFALLAGSTSIAAAAAGCYDDNCELLNTCPVLDLAETDSESEPDPDTGPAPETTSGSTTSGVNLTPQTATPARAATLEGSLDVLDKPICRRDGGDIQDGCGVFVSSSKGDDSGTGSRADPVKTLEQAMKLAVDRNRVVYACAEVFEETLLLPPDVVLVGGLDCEDDWSSIGFFQKTHIIAAPDEHAVIVQEADASSLVVDVHMEAVDATIPGGSSIAVVAWDGTKVHFERCEFVAGDGKRGLDGAPGDANEPVAQGGPNGLLGASACSGDAPAGGGLVFATCDDGVVSAGGIGGKGGAIAGSDGTTGAPEPFPNEASMGASGKGESLNTACSSGTKGNTGEDGSHGAGATGIGAMTPGGYEGMRGGDGKNGATGQGGGGGGGARGGPLFCGNKPKGGAGGGSGGGGGCGGRGGLGGGFGGASIALVIGYSEVSVADGVFLTGNGGDGGTGGMFQIGGDGGAEGHGGNGFGGSNKGCPGGGGGRGGNGGYGGGGLGGPSLAVTHQVEEPDIDFAFMQVGQPGKGGLGGNPNIAGTAGADGIAGEMALLPPNP